MSSTEKEEAMVKKEEWLEVFDTTCRLESIVRVLQEQNALLKDNFARLSQRVYALERR